jgi:hypothetical protein
MRNNPFWNWIFWICILAEPFLLTVWAGKTGRYWSPAIWLVVALIPSVLLFWKRGFRIENTQPEVSLHPKSHVVWGVFALGLLVCAIQLAGIIPQFPVSPMSSDILPSLELYAKRLLAGTDPYAPMEFPGWTVMPNYFSMRWLPFIPAEYWHFDYRWIGFTAISAVFWYYTWRLSASGSLLRLRQIFLPVAAPWFMLFVFMKYDHNAFGNAVETLIAAYYLVLAFTLFRSPAAMAFGIMLCLLSRISFTFWLPMYGFLILMQFGWKTALRTGAYVIAAVLALYVVPFILPDSGKMFIDGLGYYNKSAMGEWYRQGWQDAGAVPTHLGRGIGFAYYWYKEGAEVAQFAACQRVFQLISLSVAALLFAGYVICRRRPNFNLVVYGVVSLKVYLTIFYGFIPIPYHYLFLTPCLLNLAVALYSISDHSISDFGFRQSAAQ